MNISNFYTPIFQIFSLQMIHYDQNRYAQGEAYTVILWKTLSRLLKRNELIFPKRKRLKICGTKRNTSIGKDNEFLFWKSIHHLENFFRTEVLGTRVDWIRPSFALL